MNTTCPRCGGKGQLYIADGTNIGYCPDCGGTGHTTPAADTRQVLNKYPDGPVPAEAWNTAQPPAPDTLAERIGHILDRSFDYRGEEFDRDLVDIEALVRAESLAAVERFAEELKEYDSIHRNDVGLVDPLHFVAIGDIDAALEDYKRGSSK